MIRKLQQLDNFRELPKEKQPPEKMIWDGTAEELEDWLDKVLKNKKSDINEFVIEEDEIER